MNREQTAKAIKVMQAYVDGREIQVREHGRTEPWRDVPSEGLATPNWDWARYDFRVKPEPRRWWIRIDSNNNVKDGYTYKPHETFIEVVEVLP